MDKHVEIDNDGRFRTERNIISKEIIYIFKLWVPFISRNIPEELAYWISHIWHDIPEFVFPVRILLTVRAWKKLKQLNQWFIDAKFNSSRFMVITDDHGYVPFVVVTIPPFVPRSWLIDRCLSRVTKWVTLVEQELIPIWRTRADPRFLVGFVLLNL
jgi:hypothetical protein